MEPIKVLQQIQAEGIFTAGLPFDQFVSDLCKRYAKVYMEILPPHNYEYIVKKLIEKDIVNEQNINNSIAEI